MSFINITRRHALVGTALGMCMGLAFAQQDKPWPISEPIEIVVPSEQGSAPDKVARVLADTMQQYSGARVSVRNVVGGAGQSALEYVYRAPANTTVLALGDSLMAAQGARWQAAGALSLETKFTPLSHIANYYFVLASLNPSGEYKMALEDGEVWLERAYAEDADLPKDVLTTMNNLSDDTGYRLASAQTMQAYADQKRLIIDSIKTASPVRLGLSDQTSLAPAVAKQIGKELAEGRYTITNYPDTQALVAALERKQIDAAVGLAQNLWPLYQSGKVQILGVSSKRRLPGGKTVPTFSEVGLGGMVANWEALYASQNMSHEKLEALSSLLQQVGTLQSFNLGLRQMWMAPYAISIQDTKVMLDKHKAAWSEHLSDLVNKAP